MAVHARTAQNRRRPVAIFDLIAVMSVLGVFTGALLSKEYPFVEQLQTGKWIGYFAFLIYAFFRNARRLRASKTFATLLFMAVPLVGSVSTLTQAVSISDGLQRSSSFVLLFLLAFFLPVPPDPRERVRLWLKAFLYVNGAIVWLSLAVATNPRYYHGGRFSGCMWHVNHLAACASIFAIIMLGYVLAGLPRLKLFALLNMLGGVYCLIASGARADLLATAVASLVLVLRNLTRSRAIFVLVSFVALGSFLYSANAIINMFAPAPVVTREFLLADRTDIWAKQIESFMANPVIGWGFELNGELYGVGRAGGEGSYTDLLSAVGILGAVPFFIGIVYCMSRFHKFLAKNDFEGAAARKERVDLLNGFAVMIYILITSTAEQWMATVGTPIAIFGWVILAAAGSLKAARFRMDALRASWRPGLPAVSQAYDPMPQAQITVPR